MTRAFFRFSTPPFLIALLPTIALPAVVLPPAALAQDLECAVGAPSVETDETAPVLSPAQEDMRRLATGAGVKVAVIDTGVSLHPQLKNVSAGADFITPGAPEPFTDCDVHGTVVAGIIAGEETGLAPEAEILSIRQSSAHYRTPVAQADEELPPGAGNLETLTHAIHNALDERAGIINISVVSCVEPALAQRVDTKGLEEALGRAEHEGAVVIAAAGNASHDCPAGSTVYPAHFPTVLTVGARSDAHTVADYSLPVPDGATLLTAPGDVPFALAPGNAGWSTGVAGDRGAVEPFAGTSFAAPVVSGTAALLKQRYPDARPAQIRGIITASSEPHGGAVDPLRALSYVEHARNTDFDPLRIAPVEKVQSAAPVRGRIIAISMLLLTVAAVLVAAVRRIISTSPSTRPRG